MPREILVTSALPYANGRIHLGHIVEHVQSDIWVRAMRMAGNTVHYVCADDAHGTSIMLRAEKEGITPETLIEGVWREHTADLRDFGVAYDHYSSTHTETNRELTYVIWRALEASGHVESRPVKQLYDPERKMFLPDRFIKGECPVCHSKDQYGDACEVCGSTYNPIDLIEPYSVVSGAKPVEKESLHFFVKLADFEALLKDWLEERRAAGRLQSEVVNKLQEWFAGGLRSWDVSRDAPYFGFEIPDQPGKYFYVWVDAPIGYLAAFRELCESGSKPDLKPADFERFTREGSDTEMVHFIGKDIIYFHTLFWPAMLHGAGLRMPSAVNVHGFLTVDGAKMSKSRGTFVNARTYLEHLDADWLRYYLASMLGPTLADIDLDLKAFEERVNSHLVGKYVNIASRCASILSKEFGNRLCKTTHHQTLPQEEDMQYPLITEIVKDHVNRVRLHYEGRRFDQAIAAIVTIADMVNGFLQTQAPWKAVKDPSTRQTAHEACSVAIEAFRILTILLKPVVPALAARAEAFLGVSSSGWADVEHHLPAGHILSEYKHLMGRIERLNIDTMIEASKESLIAASPSPQPSPANGRGVKKITTGSDTMNDSSSPSKVSAPVYETISIDDFAKLDLRVGKVVTCEFVDGSDKLLRFELDAGEIGKRQIFSGIKAAYPDPATLVGRSVVFIANLAPRKMRFGVSEGMILSAGTGGNDLFLLDADPGAKPGMAVK